MIWRVFIFSLVCRLSASIRAKGLPAAYTVGSFSCSHKQLCDIVIYSWLTEKLDTGSCLILSLKSISFKSSPGLLNRDYYVVHFLGQSGG